MFTWQDILAIAVQIEQNGEQIYRTVAAEIGDPKLSKALTTLADDEAQHLKRFQELTPLRIAGSASSNLEKMARAMLRELVAENSFSLKPEDLLRAETVLEIITASIAFEQDTILFYEMIEQMVDNDQAKNILRQITAEEKGHVDELRQWAADLTESFNTVSDRPPL